MINGAYHGVWGIAFTFGVFAVVVIWICLHNAQVKRARQDLAARRGWDLQLKPAPKTPWRLVEHGGWLLDARETGTGEDATTEYIWSAPTQRDARGQIQIQHRKVAEWMSGAGGHRAMKLMAGIGKAVGAGTSFEEKMQGFQSLTVTEFSRPDMAEYRLITSGISKRQASEIVGDDAQLCFSKWRETLPKHRGLSADLKIELELERGALRVETSESLENAASLEAFIEFCLSLKR